MTTVTEAIKVASRESISAGDLESVLKNPDVARRFARRLELLAQEFSPHHAWTAEDLRAVLEVAIHGTAQTTAKVLEGRYLRKRIRAEVRLSLARQEPLSILVVKLEAPLSDIPRGDLASAVSSCLRAGDFLFLFRKRVAVLLPRLAGPLRERVEANLWKALAHAPGRVVGIESNTFESAPVEAEVLAWAEDQLRDVPLGPGE